MLLFYQDSAKQVLGPLTVGEFLALLRDDRIDAGTPVRVGEQTPWTTLEDLLNQGVFEKAAQAHESKRQAWIEHMRAFAHSRRLLKQLSPELQSMEEQNRAYAEFLTREYDINRAPGHCTELRNTTAQVRCILHWEWRYNYRGVNPLVRALLGHMSPIGLLFMREEQKFDSLAFQTGHDLSRTAALALRRNIWCALMARFLGMFAEVLALGAAVTVVFAIIMLINYWRPEDLSYNGMLLAESVGVGLLSWASSRALRRWAFMLHFPPSLRTLAKAPFQISQVSWVKLNPR